MSKQDQKFPYKSLGLQLRQMREKKQESLAEVSGAVEIELDSLSAMEQGVTRPPEDILLLLISYFNVKDQDASNLWEMAGYDDADKAGASYTLSAEGETGRPPVTVMPGDARIAYTDMLHVMVNNYGVVMNFMQTAGPDNQPMVISRIGMSREHAKSVLEVLRKTLEQSEQKSLPTPKKGKKTQADQSEVDSVQRDEPKSQQ